MITTRKRFSKLFIAGFCPIFLLATAACGEGWGTDYEAALKQGKAEGKLILLDFTGSD